MSARPLDTSPWNLALSVALLSAACGGSDATTGAEEEGGTEVESETGGMGDECLTDEECEEDPSCSSNPRCVPDPPVDPQDDDYSESAWEGDYQCYEDEDCGPGGECVFSGDYSSACEVFRPLPCEDTVPLAISPIATYSDGFELVGVVGRDPQTAMGFVLAFTDEGVRQDFVDLQTGSPQVLSTDLKAAVELMSSADLDGDGDDDLIVSRPSPESLVLESYLRGADGLFELHAAMPFPSDLRKLQIVRDPAGVASILALQSDALMYAAGDGMGGFAEPTVLELRNPFLPHNIFVGQFDEGPAEDFAAEADGLLEYITDATPPEPRPLPNSPSVAVADFSGNGVDDLVTISPNGNNTSFAIHAELSVPSETAAPYAWVSHGGYGILGIATQDVDADGANDLIMLGDGLEGALIVVRNLASPQEACVDLHVLDAPYSALHGQELAGNDGVVVLASDTELFRIQPG